MEVASARQLDQNPALLVGGESRRLRLDVVCTYREQQQFEPALIIGDRFALVTGENISRLHLGLCHSRARGIEHSSADAARRCPGLRQRGNAGRQNQAHEYTDFPAPEPHSYPKLATLSQKHVRGV